MSQTPAELTSEEDLDDERGRTPSGNNLSGAVKDLRYFFSPMNKEVMSQGKDSAKTCDQPTVKPDQPAMNGNADGVQHVEQGVKGDNNNNNQETCACQGACSCSNSRGIHSKEQSDDEQYSTPRMSETDDDNKEVDQESAFLHQLVGLLKTATDEGVDRMINSRPKINNTSAGNVNENSDTSGSAEQLHYSAEDSAEITMVSSHETNEEDNPTVISATSVMAMFSQLKEDISKKIKDDHIHLRKSIKEDINAIQGQCYNKLKENFTPILKDNTAFKKMEAELAFYKIKAETLSEVCDRMYTEISDLTTRVENLEVSSSKKMVIMTGLRLVYEKKKKESLAFLNDFINVNLGLNVTIDDFFTLGTDNPRPIILILQSMDDKRKILSTKKYLKDIRDGERRIYINEYYPPTIPEKKGIRR